MRRIAIIPARGGSKRIPRKNIRPFMGAPMISYPIKVALQSGLFDKVVVSTDDEEIAEIARQYGAEVPFLRSSKNSDDFSGTGDVMLEVLDKLESRGDCYEQACCIYATAVLLSMDFLLETLKFFESEIFDVVFPVIAFSTPIERALSRSDEGRLSSYFKNDNIKRSQDFKVSYYDSGSLYWFIPENLKKLSNKNLFGKNRGGMVMDEVYFQDIDNLVDIKMAEIKYRFLNKQS